MTSEPLNARALLEALLTGLPETRALAAGPTSYRWLLDHAVDQPIADPPTLRGLPIRQLRDLPVDLVILVDDDGQRLTSIDVTQISGADAS